MPRPAMDPVTTASKATTSTATPICPADAEAVTWNT